MAELKKRGFVIVIYTCRANTWDVEKYLQEHGIPYDFVNENPYQPPDAHPRKLYADIYVDDRAISFQGWEKTLPLLLERAERLKRKLTSARESHTLKPNEV